MQREKAVPGSFSETIDLNEGSFPNKTSTDRPDSWDNMVNPVENRLSNYELASRDGIASCMNADDNCARSSTFLDRGESSSTAYNLQERACNESSSFNACSGTDPKSEDWSFERSNMSSTSYVGNLVTARALNISPNCGQVRNNDCPRGRGVDQPHTLHKSGHLGTERIPAFYASSGNTGNSSGSSCTLLENNDSSSLSFGTWGSSCKRKALEGSSGRLDPGGSSSSNQPTDNIMQHNLSLSSGPLYLSPPNHSEQLSSRSGVGMRRVPPIFSPSSLDTEGLTRNFTIRSNLRNQDSDPYDSPRSASVRRSAVYGAQQLSRPLQNIDTAELSSAMTLPMIPNNTLNQPHLEHASEARAMHSYPWNGSFSYRGGRSSSSFMGSGERGPGMHEEDNVRSFVRNNLEYPSTVSAPETRDIHHDQVDWSFAPGTSTASRNHSSGSEIGRSSSARASSAVWLPHQNPTSQNHQRFSESAPWIHFPRGDSHSGSRRSQFALLPSGPSSSNEAATSSRTRRQPGRRSEALMMDMPGDTINRWRALAAGEDRHRMIREVLNAMRRGAHVQAEDYLLIDPFINGFAELHDRHRDLRLDVDNMSYEELLALEERIGNVSTGLSEEKIRDFMNQRRFEQTGHLPNLEPCCICKEDYIIGDQIGILNCGHEFHTSCIKQWLVLKNLCPICKMTALKT